MARGPSAADSACFAPSPERTLPARADQGRLSDGGCRRRSDWARCAKVLGHPEWCGDPRFATNQARMADRDALEHVMNAVLTTRTTSGGSRCSKPPVCPAIRFMITRRGSPTRRSATAASFNKRATHPHPDQERRERAGAHCRPEARPAKCRDLPPSRADRCGDAPAAREGRAVIRCVLTRIPRRRSQFCEYLGRLWNRLQYLVRDREKRRWLAPGAGARGLLCQGSCSRTPLLPRRLEEAKIAPQSR